MNRFLQKVKDGASKASEKAQHVMELNRLQSQIDARLKEWRDNTYEIGILAFEAYKNDQLSELKNKMDEIAQNNLALEQEIDQLEWKRCELRNEKRCACGEVSSWESNYCAKCGEKLPEPLPIHYNAAAASVAVISQPEQWEVQELRPYRHNEVNLNGSVKRELTDHNQWNESATQAEEAPLTWHFPPNKATGGIRQQPDIMKSCLQCGAQADLEAKWCERCGSPFA